MKRRSFLAAIFGTVPAVAVAKLPTMPLQVSDAKWANDIHSHPAAFPEGMIIMAHDTAIDSGCHTHRFSNMDFGHIQAPLYRTRYFIMKNGKWEPYNL